MMKIKSISISEEQYGEHKGKFKAAVCVDRDQVYSPSISIIVEPEQLAPIVNIIQQIVAANMRQAAEQFEQDVLASLNPPVEHTALEDNSDV